VQCAWQMASPALPETPLPKKYSERNVPEATALAAPPSWHQLVALHLLYSGPTFIYL